MSLQVGSRTFAPRPFTTAITLVLFVLLILLGRWQLHRAAEKRVLFDAFAAGQSTPALIGAGVRGKSERLRRYASVAAHGRYVASEQVLIDNMVSVEGQAGYFVITPFELDNHEWLLVNRGWIPLGASRAVLPNPAAPGGMQRIDGRADALPSPGIRLGATPPPAPPFPVRASYPTLADVHALWPSRRWSSATDVVLLDSQAAGGFERHWSAPGLPPLRHVGYAVQWFALAATLLVIYVVANLKK